MRKLAGVMPPNEEIVDYGIAHVGRERADLVATEQAVYAVSPQPRDISRLEYRNIFRVDLNRYNILQIFIYDTDELTHLRGSEQTQGYRRQQFRLQTGSRSVGEAIKEGWGREVLATHEVDSPAFGLATFALRKGHDRPDQWILADLAASSAGGPRDPWKKSGIYDPEFPKWRDGVIRELESRGVNSAG